MRPKYLLLILWLFAFQGLGAQTVPETVESLRFEVENLKEQIYLIIQNTDRSLRFTDAELEAARVRIKNLETENDQLEKEVSVTYSSKNGKGQLSKRTEAEIEKLKQENKDLWQELENSKINSSGKARELAKKLAEKEVEIARMEQQNIKLRDQVESIRSLAGRHQQALQNSMVETHNEAERLRVENASLKEQLKANTSYVGLNIEEQEKLTAETARYKAKYDSLLFKQKSNVTQQAQLTRGASQESRQVIDSLKFENQELQDLISSLSQVETVDKGRIDNLDQREQAIQGEKLRLSIREQMVEDREKDIAQQQLELEVKEKKYQNLEEKEKRLKLLEQQLREMLDKDTGNSR